MYKYYLKVPVNGRMSYVSSGVLMKQKEGDNGYRTVSLPVTLANINLKMDT